MYEIITASSLERALQCLWPWSPGATWEDRKSAAGNFGNAFHSGAENWIKHKRLDVPAIVKEYKLPPAQAAKLDKMLGGWSQNVDPTPAWEAEISFAYDPETGKARLLKLKKKRGYREAGAKDHELCGTADVLVRGPAPRLYDWKTGNPAYLKPAATNAQLWLLGLAAAELEGAASIGVGLAFVWDDGSISPDLADYSTQDLDGIAATLAELHDRRHLPIEPVKGSHCEWCPCLKTCPAQQQRTEAM